MTQRSVQLEVAHTTPSESGPRSTIVANEQAYRAGSVGLAQQRLERLNVAVDIPGKGTTRHGEHLRAQAGAVKA
jgi:hypothetical protein